MYNVIGRKTKRLKTTIYNTHLLELGTLPPTDSVYAAGMITNTRSDCRFNVSYIFSTCVQWCENNGILRTSA